MTDISLDFLRQIAQLPPVIFSLLIALVALIVAGMAIYAMTYALKALSRRA